MASASLSTLQLMLVIEHGDCERWQILGAPLSLKTRSGKSRKNTLLNVEDEYRWRQGLKVEG